MKLLFATNNPGKQKELFALLADLNIDLIFPQNLNLNLEVEETGETFEENSLLKAQSFAKKTGLLTAADDSGLCLAALDNFPGVKTDRWMKGTAKDKNLGLISKLKNKTNRNAKFVCVICLYNPKNKTKKFFKGEISGKISQKILGDEGFGYDPIFIPEGFNKSFAQMTEQQKNQISHRYLALKKFRKFLENDKKFYSQ